MFTQVGRELYARVPSNYKILSNTESFLNSMIKPTHQRDIQAFQLSQTLDTQVSSHAIHGRSRRYSVVRLGFTPFREFKTVLLFET